MTVAEFRRMALALPEATESSHMNHPDFRAHGRIFATLGHPAKGWAMVNLSPDQQELFVEIDSDSFVPVKGGWGLRGATNVRLEGAPKGLVRKALAAAWANSAAKARARGAR